MAAPWRIEVTNLGASPIQLPNADITSVTEGFNEDPGAATFTLGINDENLSQCKPKQREVKVYRGPGCLLSGPITDKTNNRGTVDFSAEGLGSYFGQRNIDRGAGRTNKLANPQFESGLTSWTTVGATSSLDTGVKILGTQSAKLTAASAGNDWYLGQTVVIGAGGVGEYVTLAAWFYISETGWLGPAFDDRGLYLERVSGGVVKEVDVAVIDNDTPRGAWQRAEVGVHIPAGATETIGARLYAPGTTGGIRWDAVSLTLMESLSSYATDAATVLSRIVSFLQGTFAGFTDVNKSDLLITSSVTASGTVLDRHYQFADHTAGDTAMAEFARMGLLDYWIDTDRVLRTASPRKGADRSASVTLVKDANVILGDGWLTYRGADAASQVVMLGEGDGPDREEGAANDNAAFGGVTYQRVTTPKGPPVIDALGLMSGEDLRVAKNPQVVSVLLTDETLKQSLLLGDTVAMALRDGGEVVDTNHRIIRKRWDPKTDACTLELVPA